MRFVGAALALLLGLAAIPVTPAGAASLGGKGWWWRGNPGQASVTEPGSPLPQVTVPEGRPETPKPADVPEGGLLVERLPDGASAIGAVRFTLLSGEGSPVLELKSATSSGTPALLACTSGSAWSDAEGGRWDSKPLSNCDASTGGASVAGVPGEGGLWTFNLSTLLLKSGEDDPGTIDITIVPARDATAQLQTPFRVVFEPVKAESLKTTSGGASFDTGFDASAALEGALGEMSLDGTALTDFSIPTDTGVALVEPALPSTDQGLSATAPSVQVTNAPRVVPTGGRDGDSTAAAILVILLVVGGSYYLSQQNTPRVTGLIPARSRRPAPVDEAVRIGGLGRFARPRVSTPIRLG